MITVVVGYLAGALVALLQIPQVLQVRRTRDVSGLSTPSLVLHVVNGGLWLVYGSFLGEAPIVIANSFYLSSNLVLMYYVKTIEPKCSVEQEMQTVTRSIDIEIRQCEESTQQPPR